MTTCIEADTSLIRPEGEVKIAEVQPVKITSSNWLETVSLGTQIS
jgi:hypothetical protein